MRRGPPRAEQRRGTGHPNLAQRRERVGSQGGTEAAHRRSELRPRGDRSRLPRALGHAGRPRAAPSQCPACADNNKAMILADMEMCQGMALSGFGPCNAECN